jgi:phytoene dehydrogenase-like protein
MPGTYDLIVIGGGHNGLVTAAYAARAGLKVLVLERREILGGACTTEELWPGFKVSTAAYSQQPVATGDHPGSRAETSRVCHASAQPVVVHAVPDDRYLMLGPDKNLTHREVAKFSVRDAEALPKYEAMLERVATFIEPTLVQTPPTPWSLTPGNLVQLAKLGLGFAKLGKGCRAGHRGVDWRRASHSGSLVRVGAAQGHAGHGRIIGAFASPSMPGTAYVLFHHVMGECDGARGVWGYVRGGMGGVSNAIAAAAREKGAEIRTNATVTRIRTRDVRPTGVVLEDGTELAATRVASGVDAHVTFLGLVDPNELPPEFVADVRAIDYASASLKINLALSAVPDFTALPGAQPGPQHRGTIHLCPTLDYIEEAYDDAKHGRAARNPIIEATIPSVLDDTVAPKGMHVMSMFTQYFPYECPRGLGGLLEGTLRRPLHRDHGPVRARLQAVRCSSAGAESAGSGSSIRPDRREHHAGRHVALESLLHAARGGLRRLPHPDSRALSLRARYSSRWWRHGGLWLQRRP